MADPRCGRSAHHGAALPPSPSPARCLLRIYIWCGILAACLLRLVQRRPLLARWGKRTLVVADVPYVSQCVEAFVSKRFALSYGIASIEVGVRLGAPSAAAAVRLVL